MSAPRAVLDPPGTMAAGGTAGRGGAAPAAGSNRVTYRLALASLRYRAAASLATFIAVLLGGALLVACGGLFESAIRLNATPQRLAGTPVVVGGSAGFKLPDQESQTVPYAERAGVPAGDVARVAAVPGVRRAVPDLSFPAVVVRDGRPLTADGGVLAGHGWDSAALTPYSLRDGTAPTSAGQVVLDEASAQAAGVRPGDPVEIAVDGVPASFTVSGVARPATGVTSPALFFATADVARFDRHPGTVDLVGVLPEPGVGVADLAGRIRAVLGTAVTVRTGDDRGVTEFVGVDASRLPLILLASIFGGIVLVVMALVVSATISLTVRQRQRELALLRATGATPRQVHRMVVVETMAVSLLATIVGIALGGVLGESIFSFGVDHGVLPGALVFRQGVLPFAAGGLLSLVTPFVAATLAARPAERAKPIQAMAEAAIPQPRLHPLRRPLAAVFAVGTVALAVTTLFLGPEIASATGGPAVLTGAIAVALIGPELLDRLVTALTPRLRRFAGPQTALALINTRTRAVAFAAVLTPITLATALALGNVYGVTTSRAELTSGYADQFDADVTVTAATGGIAPELLTELRSTPGVAGASALVTSRGWIEQPYDGKGSDPMRLLGVDPQDRDALLATKVTSGSLGDLTGDTVAVPRGAAEDLGFGVGDRITMRLGDGVPVEVTVVALLDGPSGYPSLVLPASLLAGHTTAGLPTLALLRAAPGHDDADLVGAVRDRVGDWPGITVGDGSLVSATFAAGLDVEGWIQYLIALLAITYAAIASVNTLAVAVLARRAEFGLQRLTGATRAQVRRMLLIEGGIVSVAGIVLGAVISVFSVWPTAIAMGAFLPSGPVLFFFAVVAVVFLLVAPVTVLAARLAMKPRPFDAIAGPAQ